MGAIKDLESTDSTHSGGSAAGFEGGPVSHGSTDHLIGLLKTIRDNFVHTCCVGITDIFPPVKESSYHYKLTKSLDKNGDQ